ncbi:hypothetical protein AHF37_08927 [Paragonimus kellicotti]|nr:hypothetical protein AHF37_08927 [Paragonimus kellicotti]
MSKFTFLSFPGGFNLSLNSVLLAMVNVHKGVLVKCDPAMKHFLLHLADNLVFGKNFVHTDLDDYHLFIDADILGKLQERVDNLMDSLSFPMTIDIN